MAEDIVDRFNNCTVRVGFVGYRDYTEGPRRFETLDMTNETDDFIDFVGEMKAFAGGDVPEDVLGGLNQALELDWKAKNRIIFHIGNYSIIFINIILYLYFHNKGVKIFLTRHTINARGMKVNI